MTARTLSVPARAPEVVTATNRQGEALFHMVPVEGGCVFTSADDSVRPIIAVTTTPSVPETDRNPLWGLVTRGVRSALAATRASTPPRQSVLPAGSAPTARSLSPAAAAAKEAWAALLAGPASPHGHSSLRTTGNDLQAVSDLRVPPLIRSNWGEMNGIFNHDTPNHFPCGTAATALAQLMRYHGHPTNSVAPITNVCMLNNQDTPMTMKGGFYDWKKMPLDTSGPVGETARAEIGKLCYDIGVASFMNWTRYGSVTPLYAGANALTDLFGYASATDCTLYPPWQGDSIADSVSSQIIRSNLDADLPVVVELADDQVVLADGYGYEGESLFVHLNMGWDGLYNAWHNLPDVISDDPFQSHSIAAIVYNVSPTETGALITGRLTDTAGKAVTGAVIRAESDGLAFTTHSNSNGIYALWVDPDRSYDLTAISDEKSAIRRSVYVQRAISSETNGKYFYPLTSTPGNSAGNDLVLSPFCPPLGERSGHLEISVEPPFLPSTSVRPPPGRLTGLTNGSPVHLSGQPVLVADGRHYRCTGYALEDMIPLPEPPPCPYPPASDEAFSHKANDLLGTTGLVFETSQPHPWMEDVRTRWEDRQGLVSQGDGHGPADSWLEVSVLGPAILSFSYRQSIAASTVTWLLDGECIHTDLALINRGPWERHAVSFKEGWHKLRFHYHHSGTGFNGEFTGINIARMALSRDDSVMPSPSVTNRADTAFDYVHPGKSKRVQWLYEVDGYHLDAAPTIPAAGTILATPPPDLSDGCYSAGTDVTLRATPFAPYRFSHWEGIASRAPAVQVRLDEPVCLRAVFALGGAGWRYDPVAKTLTDDNWLLDVDASENGHRISRYRRGYGHLDLTGVEKDTGIRLAAIGDAAFSPCEEEGSLKTVPLTSATLPPSITSIGRRAFAGCADLSAISLSDRTGVIQADAFSGCRRLSSVTPFLPRTLSKLEAGAFSGCAALTGDLSLQNESLTVLPRNFEGTAIRSARLLHVREIAPSSFSDCRRLAKVRMDHATEIGDAAFSRSPLLARIDLGREKAAVGAKAFQGIAREASFFFPGAAPASPLGEASFHPAAGRYRLHANREADPAGWNALSSPLDERDRFTRPHPGDRAFAVLPVEGHLNWLIDWKPPARKSTLLLVR